MSNRNPNNPYDMNNLPVRYEPYQQPVYGQQQQQTPSSNHPQNDPQFQFLRSPTRLNNLPIPTNNNDWIISQTNALSATSNIGFNYFQNRYPVSYQNEESNDRSDPKRPRVNSGGYTNFASTSANMQTISNDRLANSTSPLSTHLNRNSDPLKCLRESLNDCQLFEDIEEWLELEGDSLTEEDYRKNSETSPLFSLPTESFDKWLESEYEKEYDYDDEDLEGKSSIGSNDFERNDNLHMKSPMPNNFYDLDLGLLLEVSVKHNQSITELIEQFIPKLAPHIAELNLRLNKLKKKAIEEFPTSITSYGQIPDEILLSTSILCRSQTNTNHPLCAAQLIDDRDEHHLLPLDTGDPVDRTISVLCVLLENWLFHLVDWVEQTELFKYLPVEDKMQILYSSWSEMLILEFIHIYCEQVSHISYDISSPPMANSPPKRNCKPHQDGSLKNPFHNESMPRIHMTTSENSPESLLEPMKFINIVDDLLKTLLLREIDCRQKLEILISQCQMAHFDSDEFTILKFLSVFNVAKHDLKLSTQSRQYIKRVQSELCQFLIRRSRRVADAKAKSSNSKEQTTQPEITTNGASRFGHTLLALAEVKELAFRLETHLLKRFYSGSIPRESLLFEMIFTKRERYMTRKQTDPNNKTDTGPFPDSDSTPLSGLNKS